MSSRKKGASAKSGGFYYVAGGPNQQSCKNSTSTEGISMHAFPSDKETRKKWVDFVRRHRPHFQPTRYSALCSIHFEAQCFNQMFSLKYGYEIIMILYKAKFNCKQTIRFAKTVRNSTSNSSSMFG